MALPLIALALGAGAARAGIGAWQNRKNVRRQRRLVQEAYRHSADRLTGQQGDIRHSAMESLAARGLLQGGNAEQIDPSTELNSTDARITRPDDFKKGPIAQAMRAPTTLAGQTRADLEGEFGLEWRDLDTQRKTAESDLKAAGQQGTIDAIASGISTAASVYSMGKTMGAPTAAAAGGDYGTSSMPGGMFGAPKMSPVRTAMMRGAQDADSWWGGIQGLDPLNAPGSSWNPGGAGTTLGVGQLNAEFTADGRNG